MNKEQVLALKSLPAGTDGYRVPLTLKVEGGLHYIEGNSAPYFSLTYTQHRRGFPNQCDSGGAGHDYILQHFPKFADLAALHLSNIDGVPMHAEANGWYWLAGSLGGAGERYHGGNNSEGRSRDECLKVFADHCRISLDDARRIQHYVREHGRDGWAGICEDMKPRWAEEAKACIEHHKLTVYGDAWPERP